MDGLILRWVLMSLRYGEAGGENKAAPGETNGRKLNTDGEIPASHGGPAKNSAICPTLALCDRRATPKIVNAKSVVGHLRHLAAHRRLPVCPNQRTSAEAVGMSQTYKKNHIHMEKLATYFVATILMPPSLRC
jgi:hypothetical protein